MNFDPLTGGSAYIPTAAAGQARNNGSFGSSGREAGSADPFTGSGAYVPGVASGPSGVPSVKQVCYVMSPLWGYGEAAVLGCRRTACHTAELSLAARASGHILSV